MKRLNFYTAGKQLIFDSVTLNYCLHRITKHIRLLSVSLMQFSWQAATMTLNWWSCHSRGTAVSFHNGWHRYLQPTYNGSVRCLYSTGFFCLPSLTYWSIKVAASVKLDVPNSRPTFSLNHLICSFNLYASVSSAELKLLISCNSCNGAQEAGNGYCNCLISKFEILVDWKLRVSCFRARGAQIVHFKWLLEE